MNCIVFVISDKLPLTNNWPGWGVTKQQMAVPWSRKINTKTAKMYFLGGSVYAEDKLSYNDTFDQYVHPKKNTEKKNPLSFCVPALVGVCDIPKYPSRCVLNKPKLMGGRKDKKVTCNTPKCPLRWLHKGGVCAGEKNNWLEMTHTHHGWNKHLCECGCLVQWNDGMTHKEKYEMFWRHLATCETFVSHPKTKLAGHPYPGVLRDYQYAMVSTKIEVTDKLEMQWEFS